MREELFTEDELTGICSRAERCEVDVNNPHWKQAYQNLAYAANVVHAFMRRSQVVGKIEEELCES